MSARVTQYRYPPSWLRAYRRLPATCSCDEFELRIGDDGTGFDLVGHRDRDDVARGWRAVAASPLQAIPATPGTRNGNAVRRFCKATRATTWRNRLRYPESCRQAMSDCTLTELSFCSGRRSIHGAKNGRRGYISSPVIAGDKRLIRTASKLCCLTRGPRTGHR